MAASTQSQPLRLPLKRFRVLSIASVIFNCLSVCLAITLLLVATHERNRFMEYFRVIPDSSRGVGYATALITVCAITSLVSPIMFFAMFFILPCLLQRRNERAFQRAQARKRAQEARENDSEAANADCLVQPLEGFESQDRKTPPRPLHTNTDTTSSGCGDVGKAHDAHSPTVDHNATRIFLIPPVPFASTDEDSSLDGPHGEADKIHTTSVQVAEEDDSMEAKPLKASQVSVVEAEAKTKQARKLHVAAEEIELTPFPSSPLSPSPPRRGGDRGQHEVQVQKGSHSTLAPGSHSSSTTAEEAHANPLHFHRREASSPAHNMVSKAEYAEDDAKKDADQAAAMARAAMFFSRYLSSSITFRTMIWVYFLLGFASLIIIFACGTFGSLGTAFASMSTNMDMQRAWVAAYESHLSQDGLETEFNARLCRLQLDGRCSGGAVLCNETMTESTKRATKVSCPICSASQQATINGFTELCSVRYYVHGRYPTVYFTLIAAAAIILTACFVLVIALDLRGILPSTSYACNVAMADLRYTSEWARLIVLENFVEDWKKHDDEDDVHGMSYLSTHGLLLDVNKRGMPPPAPHAAPREDAMMPATIDRWTGTGTGIGSSDIAMTSQNGLLTSATVVAGTNSTGLDDSRVAHLTPTPPPPPPIASASAMQRSTTGRTSHHTHTSKSAVRPHASAGPHRGSDSASGSGGGVLVSSRLGPHPAPSRRSFHHPTPTRSRAAAPPAPPAPTTTTTTAEHRSHNASRVSSSTTDDIMSASSSDECVSTPTASQHAQLHPRWTGLPK